MLYIDGLRSVSTHLRVKRLAELDTFIRRRLGSLFCENQFARSLSSKVVHVKTRREENETNVFFFATAQRLTRTLLRLVWPFDGIVQNTCIRDLYAH